MTTARKQCSPKFKARVAIEAIRGEKTLSQWDRSSRYTRCRSQSGGRRRSSNCRQCELLGVNRAGRYYQVNPKRVARLMELIGVAAIYPKPKLSVPGEGHKICPYLLEGVEVNRVNQVWSTDITYIRMACGFVYLVAVMDLVQPVRAELGAVGDDGSAVLH